MRVQGKRQYLTPQEIYQKSFGIIKGEFAGYSVESDDEMLIRTRIAHTSADVEFAKTFVFHPKAISTGIKALQSGANIVTDVTMVESGIRCRIPEKYQGQLCCFLYDEDVARQARESGSTKSAVALAKSSEQYAQGIVAIGNAPTALFELIDLIQEGKANPALIIGVPVGFVGAAESKQELLGMDVPFITNPDRRGGSPLAAAIVNGLLQLAFN